MKFSEEFFEEMESYFNERINSYSKNHREFGLKEKMGQLTDKEIKFNMPKYCMDKVLMYHYALSLVTVAKKMQMKEEVKNESNEV